jgi:hypothetical protein
LALTAPLSFVAKGVHAALGAQVGVGTGLEVVIVTTWGAWRIKVARGARCIVAWATVVELTGWALALTLRTVIRAWRTITELFSALAIARRAVSHTVAADMAIGARRTTTTCGLGVANALHHFTACGLRCSSHHVSAWGLA